MHYCFFSVGSWERNASQMRLRELGAQFVRRGIRVTYLLDDVPYNRERVKLADGAALEFVNPARGAKQFFARRAALRRLRPDYVHVLNPSPKSYLSLRLVPSQRLVADWDEWRATFPKPWPLWKRLWYPEIDRFHRGHAALLSVASRYMQEGFERRFEVRPLYLPYAAYLHETPLDAPSPFTEPTAVYMGSFYPSYDHDVIFNAAVILKRRGLTPRIKFIGGGPEQERWRQFVREQGLDNVTIAGYLPDAELWPNLRGAHVLLFPIRPSQINLARCPAKSYAYAQARRPVITCRVSEVPEVLGEPATYVEPTAEAFAEALAEAMARPAMDVDYGIERHNWSARADTLLEALGYRAPVEVSRHAEPMLSESRS
jgi:glycosyltransferase involved in cell wall biosynthesis